VKTFVNRYTWNSLEDNVMKSTSPQLPSNKMKTDSSWGVAGTKSEQRYHSRVVTDSEEYHLIELLQGDQELDGGFGTEVYDFIRKLSNVCSKSV